jgi:hypothetical protein
VEHIQSPCTEEGYKIFHHTSNSQGIFSDFTSSLNKNSNSGYEGLGVV